MNDVFLTSLDCYSSQISVEIVRRDYIFYAVVTFYPLWWHLECIMLLLHNFCTVATVIFFFSPIWTLYALSSHAHSLSFRFPGRFDEKASGSEARYGERDKDTAPQTQGEWGQGWQFMRSSEDLAFTDSHYLKGCPQLLSVRIKPQQNLNFLLEKINLTYILCGHS